MRLLTSKNHKTQKSIKQGYLTGILHLAPSNLSGVMNTCPFASKGCRAACLNTSGYGVYKRTQDARIKKTKWFYKDRKGFIKQLIKDIEALERKAKREHLIPCVRLNGTSDIPWEQYNIIQRFPHIKFYDYTKNIKRMASNSLAQNIPNYHLIFSRSETNEKHIPKLLKSKKSIAVVFRDKLPKTFFGAKVINGEKNDLRFWKTRVWW